MSICVQQPGTSALKEQPKQVFRTRKVKFRLVASGGAILFALILGELGIRLLEWAGGRPYYNFQMLQDQNVLYQLSPFARDIIWKKRRDIRLVGNSEVKVRINSLGYRGGEFEPLKPVGTCRIVILGGSQVFGILPTKADEDWPRLAERELHRRGLAQVEVINAGTPGHATFDNLGRLVGEIHLFEPDYVVFCEAWNDMKYMADVHPEYSLARDWAEAFAEHPLRTDRPFGGADPSLGQTLPDRLLGWSQLYTKLRVKLMPRQAAEGGRKAAAEPQAELSPYAHRQYELGVRLIAAAAQAIGATPVLIKQPRLPAPDLSEQDRTVIRYDYVGLTHDALLEAFAGCDRVLEKVSGDTSAILVDAAAEMTGKRAYFNDHVHLTAAGHQRLATLLADALESRIRGGNADIAAK